MLERHVFLIGMPGSGKSTVGVLLAKALGYDFVDTDLLIQLREGCTLEEILRRKGIDAFLDIEGEVCAALKAENTVIATGGSVPLRDPAMEHLKAGGTTVYLDVPLEELRMRLSNIRTRGIAFGPGETLETLFARRTPIYRRGADVTVRTDPNRSDLEHTVEQIIAALK